jgi:hypothetical protein
MGFFMAGQAWNRTILSLPDPHLLQSAQWAELKAQFGWRPYYLIWTRNGGQTELIISQSGDLYISDPAAAALFYMFRKVHCSVIGLIQYLSPASWMI